MSALPDALSIDLADPLAAEHPVDTFTGAFDPLCLRPDDIVWPIRVGRTRTDPAQPTWRTANGPRYERLGKGLYVPVARPLHVEQRIVDAAARLSPDGDGGCVSGWAALRWRGAAYFDGRGADGVGELPVELTMAGHGAHLTSTERARVHRRNLAPSERTVVGGLPVTTVQRALFDEIRRRGEMWGAVQAIDMTAAAGLISAWLFARYVGECNSMNGAPLARHAVSLAVDESRSPRETWLRLVWQVLLGLPQPCVNRPLYDLGGQLIGIPDLLDPALGLVAEYDGGLHRHHRRRRRDVDREARFRDHGLEYVTVVQGDSRRAAAARIDRARARARARPVSALRWTLEPPPWAIEQETLDASLERRGLVAELTRT